MVDACRAHTTFYYHSLAEYVRALRRARATYVVPTPPTGSAHRGRVRRRCASSGRRRGRRRRPGAPAPAGLPPIEAVDRLPHGRVPRPAHATTRSIRVYGRDTFGWPVGVALHLFAPDVDGPGRGRLARLAGRRHRDRGACLMPRYAVLIFEKVPRGGAPARRHARAHGAARPDRRARRPRGRGPRARAGGDRDRDPRRRPHRRAVHRDARRRSAASTSSRRATSTTRSRSRG